MTHYVSVAARKTSEAKLKKLTGTDPYPVELFAREALVASRDALASRRHMALLGRLALAALADWVAKEKIPLTGEVLTEALSQLHPSRRTMQGVLTAFSRAAGSLVSQTSSGRLSRERRFEIGSDGHSLTREACANLNLARHYEAASGDFSSLIGRIVRALAKQGPAYTVWETRVPLLLCHASLFSHRKVVRELARFDPAGLALITPPLNPQASHDLGADASFKSVRVLVDSRGLLADLLGPGSSTIVLLERRLGGWTLTYPLGGADPRERRNRRYPAWARALAFADAGSNASENGEL